MTNYAQALYKRLYFNSLFSNELTSNRTTLHKLHCILERLYLALNGIELGTNPSFRTLGRQTLKQLLGITTFSGFLFASVPTFFHDEFLHAYKK